MQHASRALRSYYELEAGFYAASSVMLVCWEVRRRDFGIMLLHHVVTVTLIVLSQHVGLLRIGSAVMALHDVNDVLLESAKLASYANCPAASTALFVLFVACWAVLRLGIFPLRAIRSCWLGSREALGFWPGCQLEINLLLLALLVMHVYWFVLILRVALRKIRGGKLSDAREE
ncbi:hypothetical protein H632_c1994p1 [Helicosporidium sp. ATCC 50920]|nr:hypothetical protein H632_c1994p1 [Helicosporidium sp. ATCC 50920]|eukprot:KDD73621.1 hypothetical protein H632_c1994p1 [Helicosporidium sp. ATCC 50920]